MALLKSSADVLTGKCPFGLSVGAPSLFYLLWPVSLAVAQAPAELASPGYQYLASTWRGTACKRVLRPRQEAIVRDLSKEILSECVEFKTYATDPFWLLAKHVRQMESFDLCCL